MIETTRLILRNWQESDLPEFSRMNADKRVMEFFPSILSQAESDNSVTRFQEHFIQHGYGLWAVEVKDGAPFIGFIGLAIPSFTSHFIPCVEIGWRLAFEHWGKGYATEGAKAAIQHGFEVIGLKEIVSFTAEINIRSQSVMKRIGMTYNPDDDFDHPSLPEGHPLRRHVLYRKEK